MYMRKYVFLRFFIFFLCLCKIDKIICNVPDKTFQLTIILHLVYGFTVAVFQKYGISPWEWRISSVQSTHVHVEIKPQPKEL